MSVEAGDIVWRITGDIEGLKAAYADAKAQAEESFGGVTDLIGGAMTAAGATITATLTAAVVDFANTGDAIQNMSDKTGMSTTAVSEWGHAFEMTGASLDSLGTITKTVSRLMDDVSAGGEKSAETFKKIGINADELKGKSPDQVFETLIKAVAGVEDPLQRAAVAQELFGRAGIDLLPLLKSGAAGIDELRAEAHELGIVFDSEAAAAGDAFNDNLERLGKSVRGVGFELAQALMPAIIEFLEDAKNAVVMVKNWVASNPELAATITKVAAVMGALMLALGPLLMVLPGIVAAVPLVGAAFAALAGPVGIAIAAVAAIAAGAYFLISNWEDIPAALGRIWEGMKSAAASALQGLGNIIGSAVMGIVWVFTNPLEAIKAAWSGFLSFLQAIWQGIVAIFKAGWSIVEGIINALSGAIDWISGNIGEGIAEGMGHTGLATGGTVASSGWAIVGERGPELVQLPGGSTVYDAGQTSAAMQGGAAAPSISIVNHFGRDSVSSPRDIEEIDRRLSNLVNMRLRGMGYA
jgi:phage-related minor tail protein